MDLRSLPTITIVGLAAALAPSYVAAQSQAEKAPPLSAPTVLHVPTSEVECIPNHRSEVELYISNNGILGQDLNTGASGAHWPRDANRAYLFGGGLWFAAQKRVAGDLKKLTVVGYDPSTSDSWFKPGRYDDPAPSYNVNRLYVASEYDAATGEPLDTADRRQGGPSWPVWRLDDSHVTGSRGYSGTYLYSTVNRSRDASGPPVFASTEDFVAIFNDSDTSRYRGGAVEGMPLGLQIEQSVYTWNRADLRDAIFIRYRIINVSPDTLFNAFVAGLFDGDIGQPGNDHASIAIPSASDDSLGLAVAWGGNEPVSSYGYMGIDFLESPRVDGSGFVRPNDGSTEGQLGLTTFQNWGLSENPSTSEERYDFASSRDRDGDISAGDRKELVATGPFNLRPGDTAVATIGLLFAYAANFGVPTGTWADMSRLVALDMRAQRAFDSTFVTGTGFTSVPPTSGPRAGLSISVIPQPAHTTAAVQFAIETSGTANLTLSRVDGGVVRRQDLGVLLRGNHRFELPISDISPGVYFVTIRSGSDVLRAKVVVNGE